MHAKYYSNLALSCCLVAGVVADNRAFAAQINIQNPTVNSRVHPLLKVDGYTFRDANGNHKLEPYEDWRLTAEQRAADLVARMSLHEKAGMMLIDSLNAVLAGEPTEEATKLVNAQAMTRFIFRNPVVESPVNEGPAGRSGYQITVKQAAQYMNTMQTMAESTAHGIPLLFKSNARNHLDANSKAGINVSNGAFSAWPKEAGLAATRDLALIKQFAQIMNKEWHAIGLRSMYGYMVDLATEPRWHRIHETFSEDADLTSDIIRTLIGGLQGEQINSNSIALTIKHFPGAGRKKMAVILIMILAKINVTQATTLPIT